MASQMFDLPTAFGPATQVYWPEIRLESQQAFEPVRLESSQHESTHTDRRGIDLAVRRNRVCRTRPHSDGLRGCSAHSFPLGIGPAPFHPLRRSRSNWAAMAASTPRY